MAGSVTRPMSKEEVLFVDREIAKHYLVSKLCEIPEFLDLWESARSIPTAVIDAIRPILEKRFASMSGDGRGALAASDGSIFDLYNDTARHEAVETRRVVAEGFKAAEDELRRRGFESNYQEEIRRLVDPLGVPDLDITLMVWTANEWGLDRLIYDSGPIQGPFCTMIETELLGGMTDLSPAEIASTSSAKFLNRVRHKVAPLRRHHQRYELWRRVELWVRHKVLGDPIGLIAGASKSGEGGPESWVRQRIREATRVLGAKVPPGRPKKGGVLRLWKTMA